jgi:hypothetical protein
MSDRDLIARLAHALRVQLDGVDLYSDLLAEAAARALLAEAQPARLRYCDVHGQQPDNAWGCPECVREMRQQLAKAQPVSPPEPVRPSERIASIAVQALECALAWEPDARLIGNVRAEDIADLCSAVIAGLRPAPEPVSVAERMPTAADCDAEGRCWVHQPCIVNPESPDWTLLASKCANANYGASHWLPHWAVPAPPQEQADG